ncbi:hypothetical protein [Amycolatopsis sp. NPDC051903]|uniref:hypothetical protein n=1 Tax=Amycolatopsis sp. NPDC051903 TaxID=3363936 RepID=UPI00378E6494
MRRSPRGFAVPVPARWLLLGALVFGVLVMHHVPAPHGGGMSGEPGMSASPAGRVVPVPVSPAGVVASAGFAVATVSAADSPVVSPAPSDGGHGMLHLCLAVLLAAAGVALVVAWLGRCRDGVPPGPDHRGIAGFARAPPPRTGREVLTASCVLRI